MTSSIRRVRLFAERFYRKTKRTIPLIFHKNIFVFGAPYHSNLGDQAQSYCIEQWAKKSYPDHKVRLYDTRELSVQDYCLLKTIRKYTKKDDIVFLHSGYHTTDLYMVEENLQRKVIQLFSGHKVVALPQTIYYRDPEEKSKSMEIYNKNGNVIMLCRDEVSFMSAKRLFFNCHLLLFPDIVTTQIGNYHYHYDRRGILLCFRNDKEAYYSDAELNALKKNLEEIDIVDQTDTTVNLPAAYISGHRKEVLEEIWDKYAHYKVIVTDRYHGTIFSLISNTPVIVISSTDHKLESGVKWFPVEFKEYIQFEPDLERVPQMVRTIYKKSFDYSLPPYFQTNYYDLLKDKLAEI